MTRAATRRRTRSRPNSRLLMAIGLGAVLIVIAAASLLGRDDGKRAPVEVTGQPSLKVDRQSIDLGDVPLGQVVEVAFVLTNVGDQPLQLTEAPYVEVVEGCWPPTPAVGSTALQPGKSTKLSMRFMMHGDMGGQHTFRVHLFTDDPAQPEHLLTVLSNWVEWPRTQGKS